MLKDAGRRKFDIVMAWTIDRLGPDATTQIRLTSTKLEILQRRTVLSRAQKLIASFASAFVRLPAGITKADVGVTASEASPNVSEIAAFGCEAAITRPRRGLPHDPMPTASLISATSPSAGWIEASEAQPAGLHRWRIFFRLIGRSVLKSDRARFQGLGILRWRQPAASHGETKPSAQAGFGSCHFARHLRGVTRRRT